jgi:uncharacterized protein (TIGR02246 family)
MNTSSGLALIRFGTLLLTLALLGAPLAEARSGPKEQVAAATAKWGEVFVDDNPDPILALYGKDAVLWGTLSATVRNTPEQLRDYFEKAFKALPGHKVTFGEQLIRVYGNTAINTGYYTFSYVKDGETKTIPARYSFVYVKRGNKWMIVDHPSSAVPAPPK